MSISSGAVPLVTKANAAPIQALPDLDDDEGDAEYDDDEDEDEASVVLRQERWFARSGFGSPEWWSRH